MVDAASQREPALVDGLDDDELIARHQPLARRLARRYSVGGSVDDDLLQVAMMGLFLAARRYDPEHGAFAPFAVATVSGELKKHLRSTGWSVHVSRRVQELSIAVEHAAERLEQELGRSPTPAELSERTGFSVEDVLAGLGARSVRFAGQLPVVDPVEPDETAVVERALLVDDLIDELAPADIELLDLRFRDELSQREIARELDISQAQVHRRLRRVLADVRARLDDGGDDR